MAGERKLPETDVLRTLLLSGHRKASIARMYGVTWSAVDLQLKASGLNALAPARPVCSMIPWHPVKLAHSYHYLVRMLRLYARSLGQGKPLTNPEYEAKAAAGTLTNEEAKARTVLTRYRAQLAKFQARMDEAHAVVTYDYDSEEGFDVVPAEPGDRHYVRWPDDVPDQRDEILSRAHAS